MADDMSALKSQYPEHDEFFLLEEIDRETGRRTTWLWGMGEYPRTSVLAGQFRESRLESFDTLKEAEQKHPDVEFREGRSGHVAIVPDIAPAWFSPYDAGEHWDEEY